MTNKLNLIDVTLTGSTMVNAINTNNDRIEQAMEKTLSRDGTTPNSMESNLDMNSHRILNLPDPSSAGEPVTKHFLDQRTTDTGFIIPSDVFVKSLDDSDDITEGSVNLLMTVAERDSISRLDRVSALKFGLDLSPSADNTSAINTALAYSAAHGVTIVQPEGTVYYDGELLFPDGARWHAAVPFQSIIKKSSGNTNRALATANFDSLTGTTDGFATGLPQYIEMIGLVFDGNYMTAERAMYVNESGGGLFLLARKMKLDLVVQNMAGIGVWSECPTGNPDPLDLGFPPDGDIRLRIDTTKEEGLIWKGPVDIPVKWILQWNAGARIADDQFDGKVSSPTYGATNGGYTDGIVLDRGAEFGTIHSFGNFAGGGITANDGRINADLLIAESCHYGGIHLLGGYGQINRLDVHRVGGHLDDTRDDIVIDSPGSGNIGFTIAQLTNNNSNFPDDRGPTNRLVIGDNSRWLSILGFEIKSNERTGHGVVIEGGANYYKLLGGVIHQCTGTAGDTLASSAIYRTADTSSIGQRGQIEAFVLQCDVVLRSSGTSKGEKLDIRYHIDSDQSPFEGDIRSDIGQEWNISGTVGTAANNWRGSKNHMAFTFDSTSSAEQSVTLAHNLIGTPAFGRMQCSLVDNGSDINVAVERFYIGDYDDTNITVIYKQASTTGANTTPRVWVQAEV